MHRRIGHLHGKVDLWHARVVVLVFLLLGQFQVLFRYAVGLDDHGQVGGVFIGGDQRRQVPFGTAVEVGERLASRLRLLPPDDQSDEEAAVGVDEHMVPAAALLSITGVVGVTMFVLFSPRRPRPHRPALA